MRYIYYSIIVFIIILCFCYFVYPSNITIHQLSLDNFNFDVLYNRQPIVIEDKLVDINKIISLWFDFNIIQYPIINSEWYRTQFKYTILQSTEDTEILLSNPYTNITNNKPNEDTKLVLIKLKENQFIILPFKWYFHKNKNIKIIGIHDIITYINIF